jgi:hypothetical protein
MMSTDAGSTKFAQLRMTTAAPVLETHGLRQAPLDSRTEVRAAAGLELALHSCNPYASYWRPRLLFLAHSDQNAAVLEIRQLTGGKLKR